MSVVQQRLLLLRFTVLHNDDKLRNTNNNIEQIFQTSKTQYIEFENIQVYVCLTKCILLKNNILLLSFIQLFVVVNRKMNPKSAPCRVHSFSPPSSGAIQLRHLEDSSSWRRRRASSQQSVQKRCESTFDRKKCQAGRMRGTEIVWSSEVYA